QGPDHSPRDRPLPESADRRLASRLRLRCGACHRIRPARAPAAHRLVLPRTRRGLYRELGHVDRLRRARWCPLIVATITAVGLCRGNVKLLRGRGMRAVTIGLAATVVATTPCFAQDNGKADDNAAPAGFWDHDQMTGDWGGLRSALAD